MRAAIPGTSRRPRPRSARPCARTEGPTRAFACPGHQRAFPLQLQVHRNPPSRRADAVTYWLLLTLTDGLDPSAVIPGLRAQRGEPGTHYWVPGSPRCARSPGMTRIWNDVLEPPHSNVLWAMLTM